MFFDQLLQRLRAHNEVEAAGLASHGSLSGVLPAGTRFINNQMHAAGSVPKPGEDMTVYSNFVSPQYFASVGIAFLRGRDFNEFDRSEDAQVAIVNDAASRLFFGTEDPIGRRFGHGRQGPATVEVVGLVENAKYLNVKEAPLPTVYFPFRGQSPMTLHARTIGRPASRSYPSFKRRFGRWIRRCRSFTFRRWTRASTIRCVKSDWSQPSPRS